MKRRFSVLCATALFTLGCGNAAEPKPEAEEEQEENGETTSVEQTGTTDDPPMTTSTATMGEDTTDGSDTDGPEDQDGFCAVVRGPVAAGDDFSAVHVFNDSFDPEPAVATSGELFMSPTAGMFAHVVDGAVWVYDIMAGTHTQVSMGATVEDRPQVIEWAPTGEALLYRVYNQARSEEAIYTVRADGSEHTQLVELGVPFRSGWSDGNLAAALGREVVGGTLAKVWIADMDAATPQPIEVDAIPGADDTANRDLAPCGDGVLAEIGDGPVRDIYRVGPDGGVTAVTNDGMGGNPIGCVDELGASFFERNGNQLWGLLPDRSAAAVNLSGADGYWGSGAKIVETREPSGALAAAYLFFPDATNLAHVMGLVSGTPTNDVIGVQLNFELEFLLTVLIGEMYAAMTGDFQQTQVHMGGIDQPAAQQVYETEPGESVADAFLIENELGEAPNPDDALLMLQTNHPDGDRLLGIRGNGDLEGEGGMLIGGTSGNPFECRGSSNNFAVCLTEDVDGVSLAAVTRIYEQDGGRGEVTVHSEKISDETEPFSFRIKACAPIF